LLVLTLQQANLTQHANIGGAKLLRCFAHRAHLRTECAHLSAQTTKGLRFGKINTSLLRGQRANALPELAVQASSLRADAGLRLSNLSGQQPQLRLLCAQLSDKTRAGLTQLSLLHGLLTL
jgi:hypothetical protein